jgi:membrane-associated phospholipid phosphatase
MCKRNILAIILLNVFGFGLFFSWYLPEGHGFWGQIDSQVFYYFNQHLASSSSFLNFVAISNNRAFDAVALIAMGLLFLYFFLKEDTEGRCRLICMGLLMLITAVLLNQLGRLIPVDRPSPTLTFSNINRVSELSGIPTKDSSSDSFPGDHGLMLLIFCGFILRYFTRWAFAVALLIMVLFSLPRIMSGSHWFTDVYVGSVFVACIGLSWLLLTPASDYLISKMMKFCPQKYLRSEHKR